MTTRDDFARTKRDRNPRLGFSIHLTAYLVVNTLLVAINLATSPGRLWFKWPLLGWGVGLVAHALVVFFLAGRASKAR